MGRPPSLTPALSINDPLFAAVGPRLGQGSCADPKINVQKREEQLLQPEIRRSADQVSYLLADEFVEFGSSGRVFDKAQIIASLQQEKEQAAQRTIHDFYSTATVT